LATMSQNSPSDAWREDLLAVEQHAAEQRLRR
jgi:hypothetical protein